ncbi:MAG: hypothetical protein ACOX75_06015 [Lachnospiraceae bacterium]
MDKKMEKAKKKQEKLASQSTFRKWLPSIIVCIVLDVVCIICKGSFEMADLSLLLFANAAILLLNMARMVRINSGIAQRERAERMKEVRFELKQEIKQKIASRKCD